MLPFRLRYEENISFSVNYTQFSVFENNNIHFIFDIFIQY